MPVVTMPDGTAVDFGDLPEAQIKTLIGEKFPEAVPPADAYTQARDRWRSRYQGYGGTQSQMATEGAQQMGRGAGQLAEAARFAMSGAGRNVVPDTPANRVAGGFSALDPSQPQAPLTTAEHQGANREAVGNVVSGYGNIVQGGLGYLGSPINAALRVVAGDPIERTTGIPREYPEFAAGLAVPGKVPKLPSRRQGAPSVAELKAEATRGYEGPAVKNLEVKPKDVSDWSVLTRSKLDEAGMVPELAPGTHAILKRIESIPPGAAVTGTNLDTLRKALSQGPAQSISPTERAAAVRAMEALDEFLPTATAVKGDAKAAAATLQEARANYSAAMNAEKINKRQYRADLQAAAANSGMNVENSTRSQIRQILTSDKERRGLKPDQIAQAERIVEGTPTRNAMRTAGNLSGGGGGLGATGIALTGMFTATPGLAAAPVAGYLIKKLSNALTIRDVNKLNEAIRANSPLGKQLRGPFTDWAKAAQAAEASPSPGNIAKFTLASNNLSNNLRDAGVVIAPNDLMLRSIQGPVRSGAEEEQQ